MFEYLEEPERRLVVTFLGFRGALLEFIHSTRVFSVDDEVDADALFGFEPTL